MNSGGFPFSNPTGYIVDPNTVLSDGSASIVGNFPSYDNVSGVLISDSGYNYATFLTPAQASADYLSLNGGMMAGDIDMKTHDISNINLLNGVIADELVSSSSSVSVVDDIPTYTDTGAKRLKTSGVGISSLLSASTASTTYLPLDGSVPMTGPLDMNFNSVRNVYEVNLTNNGDISTPAANTIMVYSASKKLKYQDDTHTNFTVATTSDLSSLYVPYTGATGSVDLGLFTTKCKSSQAPTLTKYIVSDSLNLSGLTVQSMLGAGTGSLVYAANTTNNDMNICFRFGCLYSSGVASTQTLIFAVNGVTIISYVFTPGVMSNVPLIIKARITPRPPFTLWELTIDTSAALPLITFGLGPIWDTTIANTLTVTSEFSDLFIGVDIYSATITSKNQM